MEIRVIDPQNPNEHHAGVSGTVIRLVPPARHSPAPNPYRFLIDRAEKADRDFSVPQFGRLSLGNSALSASDSHQNAGEAVHRHLSSHKTEADIVSVGPPATNSNHHNARATEATYPPIDSLFGKYGISSSSARPAPSTEKTENLGTRLSPRDRGIRHVLSRFIDVVIEHSAFNDPSREMTNWGWRKKA